MSKFYLPFLLTLLNQEKQNSKKSAVSKSGRQSPPSKRAKDEVFDQAPQILDWEIFL